MNPELGTNEPEPALGPLEIAHVLFMDIVSYSVLPTDKQLQVIQQLQKLVRMAIPDFGQDLATGQVIILPTGDGMAIAFFGDPIAPLRCARQICLPLKANGAGFAVRMGIHSGPIYRHADINANANVAGSGINLAQRVMDCADGGHILVSKNVADILMQLSEWRETVHELGVKEVKNGVRVEVFNIFDDIFGNPATPSKFQSEPTKSVSERALDVAMGREIPVHEPTELVAMIRRLQSEGLKGVLETDPDFSVTPEDVRSKPLTLEFPIDSKGQPGPLDLTIRVTSPDFEPASQNKVIRIPPFADSETCTFLLTPRQLGELRVTVELYSGDVSLLSRLLRTRATTSDRLPGELTRAILTIPLTVVVQERSLVAPAVTERTAQIEALLKEARRKLEHGDDAERALAKLESSTREHPCQPGEFTRIFTAARTNDAIPPPPSAPPEARFPSVPPQSPALPETMAPPKAATPGRLTRVGRRPAQSGENLENESDRMSTGVFSMPSRPSSRLRPLAVWLSSVTVVALVIMASVVVRFQHARAPSPPSGILSETPQRFGWVWFVLSLAVISLGTWLAEGLIRRLPKQFNVIARITEVVIWTTLVVIAIRSLAP
jgi:hypothetical protein